MLFYLGLDKIKKGIEELLIYEFLFYMIVGFDGGDFSVIFLLELIKIFLIYFFL